MANRTTRTPVKDQKFLDVIAKGGTVSEALEASGYSRTMVYAHKQDDPEFDAAWEDANEKAIERMEREADRRAIEGYDKPVFYEGVECGVERKYSDTLLIFRLKAKRPDVYRDRTEVSGTINVTGLADRLAAARKRDKT